jgi:chemotaxis protein CheX
MKRLRAEYVNPFLESVYVLFSTMLGSKARRGAPNLTDGSKRPKEVMALIGLSGPVRGTVALSFPNETSLKMAGKLLMTEITELDETVSDTIAELVNIVAGNAKAKLSEQVGTTLQLTLPTVIRGDEYRVYSPSRALWLEVPFQSDLGPFTLRVTFDAALTTAPG